MTVPEVGPTMPAPTEPADSDLAKDVSNQEQHDVPIEPSLGKEHESGGKRRRREKGTLSRFNAGDSGPEGQSQYHYKIRVLQTKLNNTSRTRYPWKAIGNPYL